MNKFFQALIKLLSKIINGLPIEVQFFLGDMIGVLWFDILRIRRREALDNLRHCFPEWSEAQRHSIARKSVYHIGRSFIEFLRIPSPSVQRDIGKFKVYGTEFLEAAYKKNKGVFLLTAHVGNGDWATVGFAMHGYPISIISKEMTVKWFNDFWFSTRKSLGTEFIPARGSSIAILKTLKKNKAIAFMLDQFMGPPIGVKTQFFGRETGTAMGLALLAGRSQAPVIPIYSYRDEAGITHIHLEPEILFVESPNKEDTIRDMTQKYCDKIEEWVRKHPDQWMWVHRRWKQFKV